MTIAWRHLNGSSEPNDDKRASAISPNAEPGRMTSALARRFPYSRWDQMKDNNSPVGGTRGRSVDLEFWRGG